MITLPKTRPYTAKDQAKSDRATCFIGVGSLRSSTNAYREAWGTLANKRSYKADDVAFVSVEGNRKVRKAPSFDELLRAIKAGVTFITDTPEHRNRPYNIGERQIANFLQENGYHEVEPGRWTPEASSLTVDTWVDGTCSGNPGPGTWAAVLVCGEHHKELSGEREYTTNNRMVLIAVREAIGAIKKPCTLIVHTGSANVRGWLSQGWRRKEAHIAGLCEDIERMAMKRGVRLELAKVTSPVGGLVTGRKKKKMEYIRNADSFTVGDLVIWAKNNEPARVLEVFGMAGVRACRLHMLGLFDNPANSKTLVGSYQLRHATVGDALDLGHKILPA